MNEYYFLNIEVNDDKNICEVTLEKFDNINDVEFSFNKLKNFINNTSVDNIFKYIINSIE